MKKFNEWLSFRSNSYQEMEAHDDANAFNIDLPQGSTNSNSVNDLAEKFKKMVDSNGGAKRITNKMSLLSKIIESIYDFSDRSQISKVKNDLHTIANNIDEVSAIDSSEEIPEMQHSDDVDSKLDLSDLNLDGKID